MDDEQTIWLQEVIIRNTPRWVQFLAMVAQFKGMQWMAKFPIPQLRKYTDITIKTDSVMKKPEKGFRQDKVLESQIIRVFKKGNMIAQREFKARLISSPYAKI